LIGNLCPVQFEFTTISELASCKLDRVEFRTYKADIFKYVYIRTGPRPRLPDFSWYSIPNRGNIKFASIIPNGHKIDQMSIKHINIFYCKTLQNLPEWGFFGQKIYLLATLPQTTILFILPS
jgi:hypothetical protein